MKHITTFVFSIILTGTLTLLGDDTIRVVFSSQNGTYKLTDREPLRLGPITQSNKPVLEIDLSKKGQTILGLGASFDHATCENLSKLTQERREEVLEKLFHPEKGIGMNLMRVCIGTSDFVGEPYYTYNDLPEGKTDPEITQFSIEKDRVYVIPAIKTALKINPKLVLFGSPWSPPAWMKTSGKLGTGSVKPEFYPAFAKYLVKFIQAYEAEGIPIHAITIQNEPQMVHAKYPTTLWKAEEQRDFIRDHLGPLFQQKKITTRIWCWDHNWNLIDFPRTILSDPKAAAFVEGTAFHLYEGKVDAQSILKGEFLEKNIYFTEGSVFRTSGAVTLTQILRHWSRSYNAWVIMLDENRKPNRGPHSASATSVELLKDGSVRYNFDYYAYGQFMKFIQRDAVRVESTLPETRNFSNVVFINPNQQVVMVVANANREAQNFSVKCGGKMFSTEIPASTVGTYLWNLD